MINQTTHPFFERAPKEQKSLFIQCNFCDKRCYIPDCFFEEKNEQNPLMKMSRNFFRLHKLKCIK